MPTTRQRWSLIGLITLFVALSATTPCRAQLLFSFVTPQQSGTVGTTFGFDIDLRNGSLPAQITGFSVAFDGSSLFSDPDPFANYLLDPFTPDPLPASYVAQGVRMFNVDSTGATPGVYTGQATISYTLNGTTDQDVAAPFQVSITAVAAPEPPTLTLSGIALLGLVIYWSFFSRRRPE